MEICFCHRMLHGLLSLPNLYILHTVELLTEMRRKRHWSLISYFHYPLQKERCIYPVTEFNSHSYNSFITKPNFIKTASELSELVDFEVKSASLNTHCCLFVVFDIQQWPMRYLRFYIDERERAQHTAT